MLPFIKCLDLDYLSSGSVLPQVEECWSVSDLAQVGQFVFLLHLEEWHLVLVPMLLHLVSKSSHDDSSGLTSATMVTKDLDNAVLKRVVIEDHFFEIVAANILTQNRGLELLSLVMVLQRVAILIRSVQELLDLVLKLAWVMVMRHEHDILSEWIVTFDNCFSLFGCLTKLGVQE